MFKFLKEKIKNAVSRITKKIETEAKEEAEVIKKIEKEKVPKEVKEKFVEKQKGFFEKVKERITTKKISSEEFDELFYDLELALLENNVAVEVIEKIKKGLKEQLVDKPLKRREIEKVIKDSLLESINSLFDVEKINLVKKIKEKKEKPFIIVFFGVNGSGKTTTIAKLVKMLQDKKLSCVLAASDTWRAAAIQQLEEHANRLKVKLIKHDYGSDPAAVAFDAIQHAKAKNIDVVLVDTAGRQHSDVSLIEEMKKIVRVTKPDLKIFVGEAITGNDCIEQARQFNDTIGIDGIILAKQDVDEKGGTAISIGYVIKKPILYMGVGQNYKDLQEFDKNKIMKGLGL